MKSFCVTKWSLLVLVAAISLAAATAKFELKPFAELSEKTVSRRGADALAMPTVTWHHAETPHFVLHGQAGYPMQQLAASVEDYYESIKKDLGISQDNFERKSHIYVFVEADAWNEFRRGAKLEGWTGGICTGRELFLQARAHFAFQGHTLPHELTHLTVHRFVTGDVPLWLNEGFAEFEATRLYRLYLKRRNYTLRGLSTQVSRDRYIALAELTAAVDYPREADRVEAFYFESERLVHFLYYEHGGREPFLKFIKRQCDGLTFESALREAYNGKYSTFSEFEKKFEAYATKEQKE